MGIHRKSSTTVSFISLNSWIQKGSYCRCFYANFQKFQNRFFCKRVLLKKVCKIRTFFQIKNTAVSAEFAVGSKFHFSKLKTYLSQFIDWFLKFEKTSFIVLTLKCDQLCDQLGLCKFPISFSSKLKLGHNFSQFIHIVKIWVFKCLFSAVVSSFTEFMKEIENWEFWIIADAVLPNIFQFNKKLENWNFWSRLAVISCQIMRILFESRYVCGRGGSN